MAVKDLAKAVKYSDSTLAKLGYDRTWVHEFWLNETPNGQAVRSSGAYGAASAHANNDNFFIEVIVCDIQAFVFGDEGDEAMGVPPQPATEAEVDGKLGPMTVTRMDTWLQHVAGPEPEVLIDRVPEMTSSDHIIFAGKPVPVPGVQIVSLEEENGLDLIVGAKKKWGKAKGYTPWPKDILEAVKAKDPVYGRLLGFVHWDAGWSAPGAYNGLIRRGLGSVLGIDRPRLVDGEVIGYQWLDPGLYYGWHGSDANKRSIISFDMSCAVYAKYAKKYEELCGIPRPLLKIDKAEKIGQGDFFLGMYRGQIVMLLRVLKALSKHVGLPYHWPLKPDGSFQGRNYKGLFKDDFHGVAEHRHLPTTTKWDCRGLFAQIVALLLTDPALMAEFPEFVTAHRLHDAQWGPWLDQVKKHWQWKELWG